MSVRLHVLVALVLASSRGGAAYQASAATHWLAGDTSASSARCTSGFDR